MIQMKKAALSLAAMEGRLVIPANSVRLSSLPKIVYEFHKFPGLLDLDHFLIVNTASAYLRLASYEMDIELLPPGAVFTDTKSRIIDPGLYQRRQFNPGFLLIWIK